MHGFEKRTTNNKTLLNLLIELGQINGKITQIMGNLITFNKNNKCVFTFKRFEIILNNEKCFLRKKFRSNFFPLHGTE